MYFFLSNDEWRLKSQHARIIQSYAQGAIGQWLARRNAQGRNFTIGPVVVQSRLWFNEANESRYFLVPGLIVLIMTLSGAFLTSLVVAREWERGTLEALFVTPVRPDEILLGKTIPYFVLGMIGCEHRDGVRFFVTGEVIEVRVLPVFVFDVRVANCRGRGGEDGDASRYSAHELLAPLFGLFFRRRIQSGCHHHVAATIA